MSKNNNMHESTIIQKLAANQALFQALFSNLTQAEILWRPYPEHWCLLEIICHLYDEEREDFRARVQSVLENPDAPLTPFDPVKWVTEREYIQQDFDKKLAAFLEERAASVTWLNDLENQKWDDAYDHPKMGKLSARHFLVNWLAHDNLHIRQITRVKYLYLEAHSEEDVEYAGNW